MKAFACAFRGIFSSLWRERHMRIHFCFAFYVIVCGFVCSIAAWEWAACLICIGGVTALECINTAIEDMCDELHPEKSPGIGRAKDAAAGAVLCMAIASAAVGAVIFFRAERVAALAEFFKSVPAAAVMFGVTVPVWIIYIFGRKHK